MNSETVSNSALRNSEISETRDTTSRDYSVSEFGILRLPYEIERPNALAAGPISLISIFPRRGRLLRFEIQVGSRSRP
jgi:hypothetical protein